MVGCFGLNGPLREYFSLYRAVFQRGIVLGLRFLSEMNSDGRYYVLMEPQPLSKR